MTPLLEVRNVSKFFGNVNALRDVSVGVNAGEVTCVLGDNGAGKSSFIKILSGVHQHDEGEFLVEGEEVRFKSPREARDRGIATVFQDLAKVPILDEPTSALGVKQSGVVLRYVVQARDRGLGVIFITHNPHHAYPVGDRFVILNRGQLLGAYPKSEIDQQELVRLMAGGRELAELQ